MATSKLETITPEQFEERLYASNERLRQELAEAQVRVQQLELLVARKERFAQHLTQVLIEIDREEAEIAAMEKGLHISPEAGRRRRSVPHTTS